uniref:WRKY domain-containing protein n=2 Tax=Hordeum vulgare subsp. vulgare TaxID=112509 RepID=A0A8I6X0E6_HORVV
MDNKMTSNSMTVVHGGSEMDALLRRQQELVVQLRAIILPALCDADSRSADLAVDLFDGVIGCITGVISKLQSITTAGCEPAAILGDVISNGAGEGQEKKPVIRNAGQKRRRNNEKRSRSLVTIVPHYDGHHWRKYGQKNINGRQHARTYYRCAYTKRNCSATKTIQRQDHNGSLNCEDETAKYIVVYYGHHSCRADITRNVANIDPSVDLIQSGKMAGAVTDFEKFDQQDLDVSSLIEVFDNPELNWDIIC